MVTLPSLLPLSYKDGVIAKSKTIQSNIPSHDSNLFTSENTPFLCKVTFIGLGNWVLIFGGGGIIQPTTPLDEDPLT